MNIRTRISITLLVGILVWAASFALYFMTLAPSLTWGASEIGVDGGELLAAADTLGIPHPPGYPTYTLLLKLFATVVPVGDFAYRGNLMSAVLASTSAALTYLLALRLASYMKPDALKLLRVISAALSALVFSTAPLSWSQATITEVYALNAVFVGLLLLITFDIVLQNSADHERRNFTPKLALLGFLFGLGLGNHLSLIVVAVPILVWLWKVVGWRQLASPWVIGAFVLGIGVYVYLPIRAAQNPPINWGGASTIDGIAWMLTGRVYQDYFGIPLIILPMRLLTWLQLLFIQFNPLGIFLGILGARWIASRERGFFAVSLSSIVLLTAYSVLFNSVDSEVLMIPAIMLFAIWLGAGFLGVVSNIIAWVGERFRSSSSLKMLGARFAPSHVIVSMALIAFASLPVASVALNYASLDLSGDDAAYGYASEVMKSVPDGSIVLSTMEGRVFSLWYMRFVEETNRDVVPIAVPLLQYDWYWKNIHEKFPDRIPPEVPSDYTQALKRIVEHNHGNSKVFFTYKDTFVQESFDLEPNGNLFEARPKGVLVTKDEGQSRLLQPAR